MLFESLAMKNMNYEAPLWKSSTSNSGNMYNDWPRTRNFEQNSSWSDVKLRLSHSLSGIRESFPTARKSEKITGQHDYCQREQTGLLNHTGSFKGLAPCWPETENLHTTQFQITVEQPIRHVTPSCNVTFPRPSKARNGRRASEGFLASSFYAEKKVRAISALSEEDDAAEDETDSSKSSVSFQLSPSSIATKGTNDRGSLLNSRRFSDGCIRGLPTHLGVKKVSVVLPQPRNDGNESTRKNESGNNGETKGAENADGSTNENDDRWRELVAKAQGFKGAKVYGAVKFKSFQAEDIKGEMNRSLETELAEESDTNSEASFSSNSSHHSSSDSVTEPRNAITSESISAEHELAPTKNETCINEVSETARDVSVVSPLSAIHPRKNLRRYSVAACSPARSVDPANTVKLSGYSTQSALEQARQLLGKIQTEGKLKSKKERLDELSRALKWILEELNRIETPDRELVSLFISLRAKIVTLKSEVKTEEFDATLSDDPNATKSPRSMQQSHADDSMRDARSRRFSWC